MKLLKLKHNLFFVFLTGVFIFLFANCGEMNEQESSSGVGLDDAKKQNYIIIESGDSEEHVSELEKCVLGSI